MAPFIWPDSNFLRMESEAVGNTDTEVSRQNHSLNSMDLVGSDLLQLEQLPESWGAEAAVLVDAPTWYLGGPESMSVTS